MKRIIKLIALGVFFIPCVFKASDEFSNWSTDYPIGDNLEILSEDRYLYYTYEEVDTEFEKFGKSNREYVYLDDYFLSPSYMILDKPEESPHTVITGTNELVTSPTGEVRYIKIMNNGWDEEALEVVGVCFQNTETKFLMDIRVNEVEGAIRTGSLDQRYQLNKNGYVTFELVNPINDGNIVLTSFILMGHGTNKVRDFYIYYMDSLGRISYTAHIVSVNEDNEIYDISPENSELFTSRIQDDELIEYTLQDKLYHYYNTQRVDIGYYNYLDGPYFKEDDPITFYSYRVIESSKYNEGGDIEDINEDNEEINDIDDEIYSDDSDNQNNEIKEKEKTIKENNSSSKKKKVKIDNNDVEPTFEYLEEYPLETTSDEVNYYEDIEEDELDTENLIAFNTNKESNNKENKYKVFTILSLIGVCILLIVLLVYRLIKGEKKI